jgi:hypothetical protein
MEMGMERTPTAGRDGPVGRKAGEIGGRLTSGSARSRSPPFARKEDRSVDPYDERSFGQLLFSG